MIYGGDTMLAMPIMSLYDKDIMRMSIAAAKDMYDRAEQRIRDFNKEYGDFYSPIQNDMDWYAKNVTGRIKDEINNIYANGGDPLRNPEDRARVQRLIYSMPTDKIANLRQSAEVANRYLATFDDDTNPELEKFLGRDLNQWSTLGDKENGIKPNGIWKFSRASKYQTIDDLIEPIVKNVDYTYDEAMTKSHNDGNDYYSITRDRLMQAINDNMADILATPSGAFHWQQAKNMAAAQGGDETMARQIFDNMIGNRLSDHERIKFEANPFKLDDYRTQNDIRAHAVNRATDHHYWELEHGDDMEEYHRIFRRAEQLTDNGRSIGDHVQYELPEQYHQFIDPAIQAGQTIWYDKNTKDERIAYVYSSDQMRKGGGAMYILGDDDKMRSAGLNRPQGDYYFKPNSNMRAKYVGKDQNGNKKYRYWIAGQFYTDHGKPIRTANGKNEQWVEVKERDHNYGQNQRKE